MTSSVICAGSPRSGSTWQYNVVRLIYNNFTQRRIYSYWFEDRDHSVEADVHVIKIHDSKNISGLPSGIILTSYRDLRSVAASACRLGWLDPKNVCQIAEAIDEYISNLERIENVASYSMRYEDMIQDRVRTINEISEHIGVKLGSGEFEMINDEVNSYTNPVGLENPSGHDPATLMHRNHIGPANSNYRDWLSESVTSYITSKYGSWLQKRNYLD